MLSAGALPRGPAHTLVTVIGTGVVLVLLIGTGWMSDDAFITLRTIDNLVNGHGLRWNIAERVQAFTHPAWLITLTPFYALTREPFFTPLALQIAMSLVTVFLLTAVVARTALWAALGIGTYVSSKALIDFSTSGLENPLTHLLLVAFYLEWLRCLSLGPRWQLGVLTSGLLLCRLDLVVLVAPFWLALIRSASFRRVTSAALGFLPLIAWEAFSLLYYGRLFPNTAGAKLPPGVPWSDLVSQGFNYLWATTLFDPATGLLLVFATVSLAFHAGRIGKTTAWAVALYVGYVVSVGGDFMSGRFLTAPLLLAVAVLIGIQGTRSAVFPALTMILLVFGGHLASGTLLAGARHASQAGDLMIGGVADERRYYANLNLLRVATGRAAPADHPWAVQGRNLRAKVATRETLIAKSTGMFGFWAGPDADIVDVNALADPFLARLKPKPGWRIGHFEREVPDGYLESRRLDQNLLRDPDLRRLYDQVWWSTRSDVWSVRRLRVVLGQYWPGNPQDSSHTRVR